MCQYHIHVCPYPHTDPISSTILDSAKYQGWKLCEEPRPWGRLSCGQLSIHHSLQTPQINAVGSMIDVTNLQIVDFSSSYAPISDITASAFASSSASLDNVNNATSPDAAYQFIDFSSVSSAKCQWCTIALKAISYKSIAIQDEAKHKMATMEGDWSNNSDLRALHKDIAEKEATLDRLRQKAWMLANNNTFEKGKK